MVHLFDKFNTKIWKWKYIEEIAVKVKFESLLRFKYSQEIQI